eukprot:1921767-Pleurochrysis_carterae.AAC.1
MLLSITESALSDNLLSLSTSVAYECFRAIPPQATARSDTGVQGRLTVPHTAYLVCTTYSKSLRDLHRATIRGYGRREMVVDIRCRLPRSGSRRRCAGG